MRAHLRGQSSSLPAFGNRRSSTVEYATKRVTSDSRLAGEDGSELLAGFGKGTARGPNVKDAIVACCPTYPGLPCAWEIPREVTHSHQDQTGWLISWGFGRGNNSAEPLCP